jgi:putative SOS response-associated peptidase YedK
MASWHWLHLENWKEPSSGEWIRTLAVITTDTNELVAEIHDPHAVHSDTERLHTMAERRVRPRAI